MTLLPLILTDNNGMAMTATNVGQVYMGMSVVQVLSNPLMARYLVDRIGKVLIAQRVFSAAHAANHFKKFKHRFFHNCVYERLFTDISRWKGTPTGEVIKDLDHTWSIVFVGDAWMAPYELTHVGGAIAMPYKHDPDVETLCEMVSGHGQFEWFVQAN